MKYLFCLLLVASCAHKVTTDGGQASFDPAVFESLSPQDITTYAQTVVKRETRDPDGVKLDDFRKHPAGQIRRAALVVFETELQPSRSGLATDRNVYLSAKGKQILTEQLWDYFNNELNRISEETVTWVSPRKIKASKVFASGGFTVPDYIIKRPSYLNEEELFWRQPGQKIPEESLLQPANYRDVGLLLVPAIDLLGGAKPSQHQHHWVNDLAKELEVDAVVVVFLGAEWRRGGVDKRSQEVIPEEMKVRAQASVLYPWGRYHQVGEALGKTNLPKLNVPLASYNVKASFPVTISVPENEETTNKAREMVVVPMRRTLNRLSSLMIERMLTDIRQTHQGQ